MTTDQAKLKLLTWVQAQIGTHEGANNYNQYAAMPELTRLYGGSLQNEPWCDVFTDAAFIACFGLEKGAAMTYQPIGGGSALCRRSAQLFKDHDAFTRNPQPGDVIFFYRSGAINHQGIVTRVDGGTVYTVEGNSSDMVAERVYSQNDSSIAGYGRPDWSIVTDEATDSPEADEPIVTIPGDFQSALPIVPGENRHYELRLPYLRAGSAGKAVIAVQFQLAAQGYNIGPDGADGDFGPMTEAAVREFQRNVCIAADGIVGPNTGAALFGGEVYTPPVTTAEKDEPKADSFWNNLLTKIRK